MSELDDVVSDFLVESHESLDQLDRDLVRLEKEPGSRETLSSIFRAIHTIKGTCGFLGFSRLERVTHAGENLLSLLRDGALTLDPEITTALLSTIDAVREMLAHVERAGNDGDTDYADLIATLERLQSGDVEKVPPVRTTSKKTAAQKPTVTKAEPAEAPQATEKAAADEAPRGAIADTTIRVDVGLLDGLMNLVGELVLARNQILQHTSTQEDSVFLATCQRLNLITTELQEGVMKTRMQPIGNVWGKFPRVVRDLAQTCGKRVRIEMEGKDTELDKTIVEAIKDPLTHVVRNAIDHGIELPDVRVAKGKSPEGELRLRAFHEGGQVNIEIADDGAGLCGEKIKAKAIEKGLVSPEQVAKMTDRDLVQLIFLPGFSTAAAVTNISGRGVGMDVVRTNIERIGGTVDLSSEAGRGTTLRIKIPLTLAIVPALIVASGGARYAIPQVSLVELVRLEGEQASRRIENVRGAPVYRLRGALLPLVRLCEVLGVPRAGVPEVQNIVILQADGRQFGLIVDEINDTEEIVVKPLGKHFKGLPAFAGATIMGDGRVALILDVLGLARMAHVVVERGDRRAPTATFDEPTKVKSGERRSLLLVQIGERGRAAIPLNDVARLEELGLDTIEWTSGRQVVQYRGEIMPLVSLSEELGHTRIPREDARSMHVVVYSDGTRRVGIVVDKILDIVDEEIAIERSTTSAGIEGRAVVQGRVTDLVDIAAVVTRYHESVGV